MQKVLKALEERADAVGARLRQVASQRDDLARERDELLQRVASLESDDAGDRARSEAAAWQDRGRSIAASLIEAAAELRAE